MEFLGISSAVHGRDALRLSTTVVRGENKDNIRIRETQVSPVDPRSVDSVRDALEVLITMIKNVIKEQRSRVQAVVPVVFGLPSTFDPRALARTAHRAFPTFPPDLRTLKKPPIGHVHRRKSMRDRKAPSASDHVDITHVERGSWDIHDLLLARIRKDRDFSLTHGAVKIELRGFYDHYSELQMSTDDLQRYLETIERGWEAKFHRLSASTNPVDQYALKEMVQARARHFVASYFSIMSGWKDSRFIVPSPIHALTKTSLYCNFFHDKIELRRVFAREVIRGLNIDHNICVKCPQDPPSPPFSDVVATMIADNMDLASHGHVQPTAVMINHG